MTNRGLAIIAAIVLHASLVGAAEFSEREIEPTIASIVLTERTVAVTVNHNFLPQSSEEHQRFFAASRSDYDFRRISAEEFSELLRFDHYIRHTDPYRGPRYEPPAWWVSGTRCSPDRDPALGKTTEFGFDGSTVNVTFDCDTSVSDASLVNHEIWMTTYMSTEFFDGKAEGVIVASPLDGQIKEQIDVGGSAARAIVRDPWSADIWILTDRRIAVLEADRSVKAWREPVHGFDRLAERPDVLMPSDPSVTDPLAIIAYTLGKRHYRAFYLAIRNVSFVPEDGLISRFVEMDWYYRPRLPQELVPLLDNAEPTRPWRTFACMLDGERAKALCETPTEDWPTTGTEAS